MSVLLCADISCETSVTSERASLLTARTLPICHVDKSCDQCYSGVRRLLESCTVTAARYGAGGYTEFRHWIPAWPGRCQWRFPRSGVGYWSKGFVSGITPFGSRPNLEGVKLRETT